MVSKEGDNDNMNSIGIIERDGKGTKSPHPNYLDVEITETPDSLFIIFNALYKFPTSVLIEEPKSLAKA